jgi:hypothetical protein
MALFEFFSATTWAWIVAPYFRAAWRFNHGHLSQFFIGTD